MTIRGVRSSSRLVKLLAAFIAASCTSLALAADMKTLVDELRHEPLSVFDWGLFLLEEELQSVRRHSSDFLRVFYQPSSEHIVVDAVFFVEAEEISAVTAERACYTRLHAIKLTFGIIDTDRIHLAPASDFRLGSKFSHRDSDAYPELPDAAKIGKALLNAVDIRVGITSNSDEFPFDLLLRCNGMAMSQDVNYGGAPVKELLTP